MHLPRTHTNKRHIHVSSEELVKNKHFRIFDQSRLGASIYLSIHACVTILSLGVIGYRGERWSWRRQRAADWRPGGRPA